MPGVSKSAVQTPVQTEYEPSALRVGMQRTAKRYAQRYHACVEPAVSNVEDALSAASWGGRQAGYPSGYVA
ncbi:MAG: hypothetical protein AAFQ82_18905, partial [Myxococcota bacterium]